MDVILRNNVKVLGEGPRTLVFAHGFGSDQSAWWPVAREFQQDHRIVLFDHVGFGGSDRLAHTYDRHDEIDGYALDLLDILHRLALGPVTVVGHSVGGVIALLASIVEPALFEQLVLVNTSPHFIDEPPDYVGGFSRRQMAAVLDLMKTDYDAWARSVAPLAVGRDNDPQHIESFGQALHSLDRLVAQRFGHLAFYVDCRRRLAEATVPSLIVQSLRDEFAPVEVGRYLNRELRGSTLVEIDASGHCPHLTSPGLLVSVLREHWARDRRGAGPSVR